MRTRGNRRRRTRRPLGRNHKRGSINRKSRRKGGAALNHAAGVGSFTDSNENSLNATLKYFDRNFGGKGNNNTTPGIKLERMMTTSSIISKSEYNREDRLEKYLLPLLTLNGNVPLPKSEEQFEVYKNGIIAQGVNPSAINALVSSYKTYLNFPRSNDDKLTNTFFRIESYKKETIKGEAISELDYASVAAMIKYLSMEDGKLRYLPEAIVIICETCFIHLPIIFKLTPDKSIMMLKIFMRVLYNEQYDLGLGMDYAITQNKTMISSLQLLRGVRGNNALYFKSLQIGVPFIIPTLTSATTSEESALRFTDPSEKTIVIFRLGHLRENKKEDQLLPGFVVSGSLEPGQPSEWEVLLVAQLICIPRGKTKLGDITYYIVDIEGGRKHQDPVTILTNIDKLTEATLNDIHPIEGEPLEPGEDPIEKSLEFLDNHYPHGTLFKQVLDHMSDKYDEVDDPSQVLGNRLYRFSTVVKMHRVSNIQPPGEPPPGKSLERSNTIPTNDPRYYSGIK